MEHRSSSLCSFALSSDFHSIRLTETLENERLRYNNKVFSEDSRNQSFSPFSVSAVIFSQV
jgi:hypothetical protein